MEINIQKFSIMVQDLKLNLLTFNHPSQHQTFNFYLEPAEGRSPLQRHEFPIKIKDTFPDLPDDTQNIYTDFKIDAQSDTCLKVDLNSSIRFAKHYYAYLLHAYFKTVAHVTNINFVNDIELWFLDASETNAKYNTYLKFVIRVQIARLTDKPELLISYDGRAKVLKDNMLDEDYNTDQITWVIYKNQEYRFRDMDPEQRQELKEIYPILNRKLKAELAIKPQYKRNPNKIKSYYEKIDWFRKNYLITEEFKALLPLTSDDFHSLDQKRIFKTSTGSNLLKFAGERTDTNPNTGLNNHGPYSAAIKPLVKFIYICHEGDKAAAVELGRYFKGEANDSTIDEKYKRFKGLKKYISLSFSANKEDHITFANKENPIEEIRQQIKDKSYSSDTRYLALYISPYSKNCTDESKKKIYFQVKEELLKHGITSQVVTKEKIISKDFYYSLPNIAVAILAKLGGIPWQLKINTISKNDLVVGVGAFKSKKLGARYIGSAFCFSQDGIFKEFRCYPANDTRMLAGSIKKAIEEFKLNNPSAERLIIHFYKRMSRKELQPILDVLYTLGLDIPVIILSINKTESKDYVVFDHDCPELIPDSGTIIHIGYKQYLLCNNTRYGSQMPKGIEGYPLPVKITISSTKEDVVKDGASLKALVDQVYQFSRVYWKSVSQQNLPVTIKYPEMVAEIYPHFENQGINDFGENNLWFL